MKGSDQRYRAVLKVTASNSSDAYAAGVFVALVVRRVNIEARCSATFPWKLPSAVLSAYCDVEDSR